VSRTLSFVLLCASVALAQEPRGKATHIPSAEIEATVQKTATAPVSDQQIRVVSINGEYNVGAGVVHRARTEGKQTANGVEHSQITEVYHFISGSGTLVTDGTIDGVKPYPADSPVTALVQRNCDGPDRISGGAHGPKEGLARGLRSEIDRVWYPCSQGASPPPLWTRAILLF